MPEVSPQQSSQDIILDNKIAILSMAVTQLQVQQKKHHEVLIEGNGELPVVERLRDVERFNATIKFWTKTIAVAIVLQTITFGTTALIYFIRLYPLLSRIAAEQR